MEANILEDTIIQRVEDRARKLFWGSLLLNVLIVIHLFYLARAAGGVLATVQSFLPAVLLWSLSLTAYSFYVLSDISRQMAQRLAGKTTDLATGVFSLTYLQSCLEQERHRAAEEGVAAAVVYVDSVNLDRVNQNFGHTVGDIVLKALAQEVAGNVRPGDVVGRVGGDEFLVIMPETTLREAQTVVEGIRTAVRGHTLDLGKRGKIDFLDCRTGVAAFPAEGDTADIIAVARQKMIEAASADGT